jgi:hypothetical protein
MDSWLVVYTRSELWSNVCIAQHPGGTLGNYREAFSEPVVEPLAVVRA